MASRLKPLLIMAAGLCIAQTMQAQQHYNAWFRSTLSIPAGEKFRIDAEFQHRRQNGLGNSDMLDRNLMFTFRNWIHYQHNRNIKISVSPFAYFSHYRIIQQPTDVTANPNSEIRFSAAVDLQHRVFKNLYVVDRAAIEYRVFENPQSDINRLRNRFGFRYDLTDRLKSGIYDELFVNVSGAGIAHFYDHNRVMLNMEYSVLPNLKFDMGYINLSRLLVTSDEKLHEHNIYLNVTFQWKNRKQSPPKD